MLGSPVPGYPQMPETPWVAGCESNRSHASNEASRILGQRGPCGVRSGARDVSFRADKDEDRRHLVGEGGERAFRIPHRVLDAGAGAIGIVVFGQDCHPAGDGQAKVESARVRRSSWNFVGVAAASTKVGRSLAREKSYAARRSRAEPHTGNRLIVRGSPSAPVS